MAIKDILDKILKEAEEAVARIKEEEESEERKLVKQSEEIEAVEIKGLEEGFAEEISSIELKTKTMAGRETAKVMLSAKQNVIKAAMEKLYISLEQSDDVLYSKILEKLFAKFPFQSGKIVVPVNRLAVTEKFVPVGFQIETDEKLRGGFLVYADGAEADCSFRSLVLSEFTTELEAFFAEKLKLL